MVVLKTQFSVRAGIAGLMPLSQDGLKVSARFICRLFKRWKSAGFGICWGSAKGRRIQVIFKLTLTIETLWHSD
jgi:hypothetical protein